MVDTRGCLAIAGAPVGVADSRVAPVAVAGNRAADAPAALAARAVSAARPAALASRETTEGPWAGWPASADRCHPSPEKCDRATQIRVPTQATRARACVCRLPNEAQRQRVAHG